MISAKCLGPRLYGCDHVNALSGLRTAVGRSCLKRTRPPRTQCWGDERKSSADWIKKVLRSTQGVAIRELLNRLA